ncbi:MAG: hypothetical protein DRJ05_06770 [Bacteroidetes bacterium]|nr:MAG: hypothetical protein DRJ05_06770 [Bacteroidota bacterium]
MAKHTESEIVEGLINEDADIIKFVYQKYFSSIEAMVSRFQGLKMQAEDVFQEGITRAIINIRNGKFKGGSLFSTYLFSISRNICLKEINRDKKDTTLIKDYAYEDYDEDKFELYKRMIIIKNKLDQQCVDIIDLRMGLNRPDGEVERKTNMKFEEISRKLNLSVDNARQRFKRCLEKLKRLVLADPLIKESM